VAIPKPPLRTLRPLVVVALAAAALGVAPATGNAAPRPATPTTAAAARTQLAQLSEQAEVLAEHYNDARVIKAKRDREYKRADRQARVIQAQYAELAGQVRVVVSSAYKNVPFGQFTTMLTSGSPREFIDQLSALGLMASRRGALINKITSVRTTALRAQADAQAALGQAQKVEREIRAKRSELQRRSGTLRTLLSRLDARERAALAGVMLDGLRASRSNPRAPVFVGPASPAALTAVQVALAQRGDGYCWGCAGPGSFDCSGLTLYAWAAAGVALPHSSSAQYGVGARISRGEVRAGDLVFFYSPIHHVGIAINNTQMVHAPTYGQPVQVANIDSSPFVGATRVG